jgi:histidine ammonia-lyase
MSMGANGATKALRVMDNLERILAIELMNAFKRFNLEDRFSQVSLSKCF